MINSLHAMKLSQHGTGAITSPLATSTRDRTDATISKSSLARVESWESITEKLGRAAIEKTDLRNPPNGKDHVDDLEGLDAQAHEGWFTGGLKALTGFATRLTVKTLEAASPYLNVMADTAYETAKSESPTIKRFDEATTNAALKAKDLRTLGKEMVASADRTTEYLTALKANRQAASAAAEALTRSGKDLMQRMVLQGTVATASVAGLGALQQLLARGSTSAIISTLPFANMPLGSVALAGSALALCSPQGVTFCRAAGQLAHSLFSSGSSGADAATELAESAVSTQRAVGHVLQHMPSGELRMLAGSH